MFTKKDQQNLDILDRRMALPKWKFVLKYGVLLWGIPVAIFVTVVEIFFFNRPLLQQWEEYGWLRFIILPLLGIPYGFYLRGIFLKQQKRLAERKAKFAEEV